MKLTRVLGCLFFLTWCLSAQPDESDILKKLNADWISCYVTHNTKLLESILADDIILTDPTGGVFDKKKMLAGITGPNLTVLSDHVDDVTVRLFGAIAIVNARTTYVFKTDGKQMTGHNCYMDVYAKRNGSWKCVAAHVSALKD